jgi:hypothetical protein
VTPIQQALIGAVVAVVVALELYALLSRRERSSPAACARCAALEELAEYAKAAGQKVVEAKDAQIRLVTSAHNASQERIDALMRSIAGMNTQLAELAGVRASLGTTAPRPAPRSVAVAGSAVPPAGFANTLFGGGHMEVPHIERVRDAEGAEVAAKAAEAQRVLDEAVRTGEAAASTARPSSAARRPSPRGFWLTP